jgi:hypothetical protein
MHIPKLHTNYNDSFEELSDILKFNLDPNKSADFRASLIGGDKPSTSSIKTNIDVEDGGNTLLAHIHMVG